MLHLGNIEFDTLNESGHDAAVVKTKDALKYTSELLGVDSAALERSLIKRVISAGGEKIETDLTLTQANDALRQRWRRPCSKRCSSIWLAK